MSKLIFSLATGDTMEHEGSCFDIMKSKANLDREFEIQGILPAKVTDIEYILEPETKGYSRKGKKIMVSYINKVLSEPSIRPYLRVGVSGVSVWTRGLSMPANASGSAIYVIFSLLRYVVEHPEMVMTIMEYNKHLDFDRALYLAHFTKLSRSSFAGDIPDTSATYPSLPVHHSVIDTVSGKAFAGGYNFLSEVLPVISELRPYNRTYSYGSIQWLMGVNNSKELKLPYLIEGDKQIKRLGAQL